MRGYQPGRFSSTSRAGAAKPATGDGTIKIEMHFLPDVYVTCEVCQGQRYNRETLEVRYQGQAHRRSARSCTVEEAVEFFVNVPTDRPANSDPAEVGLGYMRLGQPATTLSGGEAQRVKLASELQRRSTGRTLYVLDEPTTGLHFEDIQQAARCPALAWWTRATRSWSSSTTWTSSRPPTRSLTSDPKAGRRWPHRGHRHAGTGGGERRQPHRAFPGRSARSCPGNCIGCTHPTRRGQRWTRPRAQGAVHANRRLTIVGPCPGAGSSRVPPPPWR